MDGLFAQCQTNVVFVDVALKYCPLGMQGPSSSLLVSRDVISDLGDHLAMVKYIMRGLLNLTLFTLGSDNSLLWGCPVHHAMPTSILGLYSLDAGSSA